MKHYSNKGIYVCICVSMCAYKMKDFEIGVLVWIFLGKETFMYPVNQTKYNEQFF